MAGRWMGEGKGEGEEEGRTGGEQGGGGLWPLSSSWLICSSSSWFSLVRRSCLHFNSRISLSLTRTSFSKVTILGKG